MFCKISIYFNFVFQVLWSGSSCFMLFQLRGKLNVSDFRERCTLDLSTVPTDLFPLSLTNWNLPDTIYFNPGMHESQSVGQNKRTPFIKENFQPIEGTLDLNLNVGNMFFSDLNCQSGTNLWSCNIDNWRLVCLELAIDIIGNRLLSSVNC